MSIILSDYCVYVYSLFINLELNCLTISNKNQQIVQTLRDNFYCSELAWGLGAMQSNHQQVDIVVASDVVYDPTLYEPLRDTLLSLLNGSNLCLLAHRHRHPNDKLFFTLLSDSNLSITEVFYDVDRDVHIFIISR